MKTYYQKKIISYRNAIAFQTKQFYDQQDNYCCVKCVFKKGNTVDHKSKSFDSLVREFEQEWGILDYEFQFEIVKSSHPWYRYSFDDSHNVSLWLKEDWQEFHQENADYQLLCSNCNSKKGR